MVSPVPSCGWGKAGEGRGSAGGVWYRRRTDLFLWKPVSGDRRGPSVVLWNQGDECICGVFKTGEVPVLERRDGKIVFCFGSRTSGKYAGSGGNCHAAGTVWVPPGKNCDSGGLWRISAGGGTDCFGWENRAIYWHRRLWILPNGKEWNRTNGTWLDIPER